MNAATQLNRPRAPCYTHAGFWLASLVLVGATVALHRWHRALRRIAPQH